MAASDSEQELDPKSDFPNYRRGVALKSVKAGYTLVFKHAATLVFLPVTAALLYQVWNALHAGVLHELYRDASQRELQVRLVTFVGWSCLLSIVVALALVHWRPPVYLLDFSVYKPPASMKVPMWFFIEGTRVSKKFDQQALDFQEKIIERAGLGDETYVPVGVRARPPAITMENARKEAEMVMFGAVADALQKTGLTPDKIDILVVNCSLFNPTPSLAAMIINHFHMRADLAHYNLGGMGCSAGLIAVDLAARLLLLQPGARALVVSTENITLNWYFGNVRSMLLPNCLFRMGCSAVVLTSRRFDFWRAKYRLAAPIVRTMTGGANEAAYKCIYQMEDDKGHRGVKLTRQLMGEAGRALKQNITTLGPLVLPFSEQLLFLFNLIARKVIKLKVGPYIPDFTLAFDHVCIHTGGRAVVEEIEKQLRLPPALVAPSKATLYRYGNTSSSSIWYTLAQIETQQGVRPGERVWQIGFGSGFKCNSAVWRALRHNNDQHVAWLDGVEMEKDPKWSDEATWDVAREEVNGAASEPNGVHSE